MQMSFPRRKTYDVVLLAACWAVLTGAEEEKGHSQRQGQFGEVPGKSWGGMEQEERCPVRLGVPGRKAGASHSLGNLRCLNGGVCVPCLSLLSSHGLLALRAVTSYCLYMSRIVEGANGQIFLFLLL